MRFAQRFWSDRRARDHWALFQTYSKYYIYDCWIIDEMLRCQCLSMKLGCFVPLDRHTSSSLLRHTQSREIEVILSWANTQSYLISIDMHSYINWTRRLVCRQVRMICSSRRHQLNPDPELRPWCSSNALMRSSSRRSKQTSSTDQINSIPLFCCLDKSIKKKHHSIFRGILSQKG